MPVELPKQYDPHEAQQRWLAWWEQRGYFHSEPDPARPMYSIVIPPPNVTGALHMGHALNNTLQDVLIRWRRMQGFNAEWMPGTDHAGIATQAVVERLIYQQEKKTRHDLGREELVRRIWQWKDKYEARILGQLRELGCSCDWPRTRFTLDEGCSRAVRVTFFNWFRDGYIFRGKRLVNWDAQLQTSVADDETYVETVKGGFWTFKYPVKELPGTFIRFSTTRPETMLGDTAVCVHPDDPRYRHLIGKTVTIPLVGRDIPIIADSQLADPTLGTGCVKVTPAHDPNDYACWQRHPHIGIINILHKDGTINHHGGKYAGMDRYQAREAVIRDMDALGLFEGREDRDIPLAFSDRSKTPIEPFLSDQWFVRMGDRDDGKPGLAQLAIDAVTSGRVKFFPPRYAQTYLDWLGEKRDWCISRQLWWGHRIPIWYSRGSEAELRAAFAGRDDVCWRWDDENGQWLICSLVDLDPQAPQLQPLGLMQDPDVLDTWFSSQLWPHSTFGWPDRTPELAYYYPTSTLVTSRDIITLWVARMVLAGLYNTGDVPFREVYITPKLLDGFGVTMSKSRGNGVDPLDIIERYGADALRFQMVSLAGETQDSRLPIANVCPHCDFFVPLKKENTDPDETRRPKRITCPRCRKVFRPGGPWTSEDPTMPTAKQASESFEVGRNFANKLWNAARFILLNLDGYTPGPVQPAELPIEDRWILSRLATTIQTVTGQLEGYHFSDVARTLYDFTWSEFCDWYIEMAKGRLRDGLAAEPSSGPTANREPPGSSRRLVQRVLVGVLDAIVRLVHPVMPFVAESIWQALNEAALERGLPQPEPAAESVVVARWPHLPDAWREPGMEERVAQMQELVRAVRDVRSRYNIDSRLTLDVAVRCSEAVTTDFQSLAPLIRLLAGVGRLEIGPATSKPPQAASHVAAAFEAYVSLAGLIDVAAEVRRLEKQRAEKEKHLQAIRAKLDNPSFRDRAPAEVVQQQRQLLAEGLQQLQAIEKNLAELQRT
ncbi:MAG: valine--tRNA ligase [Gemmataceae bacterium]|nr:valine--tRNA ligase [Gemmataceae bacterium]MDW8265917.1 valine--tRNA ligase [Gemmataceae bacterium]